MTIHVRPQLLVASSVDRPLTPNERRDLSAHLQACSICSELARDLRSDAAALAAFEPIPPPARIRTEIERIAAAPPIDPGLVRAIRIAAAVAVVLLFVVIVGVAIGLMQPR